MPKHGPPASRAMDCFDRHDSDFSGSNLAATGGGEVATAFQGGDGYAVVDDINAI